MIVVKLELHSAVTGDVTEIGRAIIANTGGTAKRGNYRVAVGRKVPDGSQYDNREVWHRPLREGAVTDYPRKSYNVWRLIARALLAAFPEEAKK
jgi:hypothetical protein